MEGWRDGGLEGWRAEGKEGGSEGGREGEFDTHFDYCCYMMTMLMGFMIVISSGTYCHAYTLSHRHDTHLPTPPAPTGPCGPPSPRSPQARTSSHASACWPWTRIAACVPRSRDIPKVLFTVNLQSKYTRALTFQIFFSVRTWATWPPLRTCALGTPAWPGKRTSSLSEGSPLCADQKSGGTWPAPQEPRRVGVNKRESVCTCRKRERCLHLLQWGRNPGPHLGVHGG
jgi:hypothetical protein